MARRRLLYTPSRTSTLVTKLLTVSAMDMGICVHPSLTITAQTTTSLSSRIRFLACVVHPSVEVSSINRPHPSLSPFFSPFFLWSHAQDFHFLFVIIHLLSLHSVWHTRLYRYPSHISFFLAIAQMYMFRLKTTSHACLFPTVELNVELLRRSTCSVVLLLDVSYKQICSKSTKRMPFSSCPMCPL